MKQTPTDKAAARLGSILGTIAAFDRKTKRESYTDTGEAWEILEAIRKDARAAIRAIYKTEPNTAVRENLAQLVKTVEDFQSGRLITWPASVLPQARAALEQETRQ